MKKQRISCLFWIAIYRKRQIIRIICLLFIFMHRKRRDMWNGGTEARGALRLLFVGVRQFLRRTAPFLTNGTDLLRCNSCILYLIRSRPAPGAQHPAPSLSVQIRCICTPLEKPKIKKYRLRRSGSIFRRAENNIYITVPSPARTSRYIS